MPRLFIALDLPEAVKESLGRISYGLPGAAWISPEDMHLTVRFIGEVDDFLFRIVREALAGVLEKSFYLNLKGVGHFPKRGDPTVLWTGVPENEGLIRLRNRIENLLVKRGVEPETRKFHPHITLAKIKDSRAPWIGQYLVENALFSLHGIPVQGFSLYSSRLTLGGAIHHQEATYPLDGLLEVE